MKKKPPVTSEKVKNAYRIICAHSGITKAALCKELGIRSQNLDGLLAGLERANMLVSEAYGAYYKFEAKP
jgi:myo-inositol-hexaphosphate 3-phosphohydrolase